MTTYDPSAPLKYFHQVRFVVDYSPNWRPIDDHAYVLTIWVRDTPDGDWRLPANEFERRKAVAEVNNLERRLEQAKQRYLDDFEMSVQFPTRLGGFDMGDFQ